MRGFTLQSNNSKKLSKVTRFTKFFDSMSDFAFHIEFSECKTNDTEWK